MHSPQLENGFTRIANELYEAIIGFPLTGYQQRVLHAIIRKTYGFGKKSDKISLSQLSEMTKIAKPHVCRAIKELKAMNIVTTDGNKTSVNKNHELWLIVTTDGNGKKKPKPETPLPPMVKTVTTDGNKPLPPAALQKKTKETIQKKYTNVVATDIADVPVISGKEVNRFLAMFKNVNPEYDKFFSNKSQRKAMQDLIEKYKPEMMEGLLLELPTIVRKPYAPMITSPIALQKKMGDLLLFVQRNQLERGGVADGRGVVWMDRCLW